MTLSEVERLSTFRVLARTDLYFLLRYAMKRPDVQHPWLFARCKEVQANPDGYLDLWAREHYKSTIVTVALTIQDILASHGEQPVFEEESTTGIFSHTRPIAKKFLRQIKQELENNDDLKSWFPDILYANPEREAPVWSLDSGIVVKRRGNPKEATVEAYGCVDGQPTGAHFNRLVYDDLVTLASVTSTDMIEKTAEAWKTSLNLGARRGKRRMVGTRYHFNDTYAEIIRDESAEVRLYPATEDGTETGEPVFLTTEELRTKRKEQGPYVFGCQMLQNPKADSHQGFQEKWLEHYGKKKDGTGLNIYLLFDPANEKNKKSDYTAAWAIACAPDQNIYALDIVRDRLSLTERANLLFKWHRKYGKHIKGVAYERYGLQADIDHFEDRMERDNYRFTITEVGGSMGKGDRIKRLIPWFEQSRIILPEQYHYTDYEKKTSDLVEDFIQQEYKPFPVATHDDLMDGLSRLCDLELVFPSDNFDMPKLRTHE